VATDLGDPFEGPDFFYSGAGDDLDVTMTKQVTVGAGAFSARVRYEIEQDWDYAYLTVNGNPVATNLSANTNPNGQNFGNGITGSSGGNWVSPTANLAAFVGQTVTLGFRYWTERRCRRVGPPGRRHHARRDRPRHGLDAQRVPCDDRPGDGVVLQRLRG
jgi:immune inhibitor A